VPGVRGVIRQRSGSAQPQGTLVNDPNDSFYRILWALKNDYYSAKFRRVWDLSIGFGGSSRS
jgi:hypothetical protein